MGSGEHVELSATSVRVNASSHRFFVALFWKGHDTSKRSRPPGSGLGNDPGLIRVRGIPAVSSADQDSDNKRRHNGTFQRSREVPQNSNETGKKSRKPDLKVRFK
ncbi:hypothetical protein JOB18_048801 [Solea senegalensis]|uniref:Uncharacterized protein n=1 Tax=Solea senegalensis TaxID=28829 RepID=A0AAV6R0U2_SOLSE|nr:hypothetical protein JOB18_048801 [Solea senegalensis]